MNHWKNKLPRHLSSFHIFPTSENSQGGFTKTSRLILFPWRNADVVSNEYSFHFILAAVMNIIRSDCRLQVGDSVCCKLFFSSKPRATIRAFRNFSPSNFCFFVKTHLHEIAFWPSSSTQVKILFSVRFFNSFSFASITAASCSCCSVSINASNSVCSHHMTSSQFMLYGCSLPISTTLIQFFEVPVRLGWYENNLASFSAPLAKWYFIALLGLGLDELSFPLFALAA